MTAFGKILASFILLPLATFCVFLNYHEAFRDEAWRLKASIGLSLTYMALLAMKWNPASWVAFGIWVISLFIGGGRWKKLKKKLSALRDTMTSVEAATWRREIAEAQ